MSSSLSPEHYAGSGGSQGSPDPQDKTMLSNLNLNFLKNLSDKKVTRGMLTPSVMVPLGAHPPLTNVRHRRQSS